MDNPNCYKCKYQGSVVGSSHSYCKYPGTKTDMFDFCMPINRELAKKLQIEANPHGVRMGWFTWPVNFDPVWLMNCNGFEAKPEN